MEARGEGQPSQFLRNVGGGGLAFWCPGCHAAHTVWDGDGKGPRWTWNGDAERPTFRPSLLVQHPPHVCHCFVTNGQIEFLDDCTHELAGQVVDMQAMPERRQR